MGRAECPFVGGVASGTSIFPEAFAPEVFEHPLFGWQNFMELLFEVKIDKGGIL